MPSVNGTIHRKHFHDYFADSAVFAVDASEMTVANQGDQERQRRYARSSILASALCLESAANCCLDFLQLQKGSHEDYEQLKTLAKFDLFLHHVNPGGKLDRGHKLVQPIKNLLSCRNEYVHSKVILDSIKDGSHTLKIWEPLGLPHNSIYWQPLHAIKVFTVISDFLNHFFFELCGFPYEGTEGRGAVGPILTTGISSTGTDPLPGGINFSTIPGNAWGLPMPAAKKWDLDFAFLGIHQYGGPENRQIFPRRKLGDYSHCDLKNIQIPLQPVSYRSPGGFSFFLLKVDKT